MKTDQKHYLSQYVISISDYLFRIMYIIDTIYKNCLKINSNLKYNLFILIDSHMLFILTTK